MDWNWYYSTLSQSAAGIVGIIGAFIITKILSNQVAFLQKSATTKQLLAESKFKKAKASQLQIEWYNYQHTRNSASDFVSLFFDEDDEDRELCPEEILQDMVSSVYIDRELALEIVEAIVIEHKENLTESQSSNFPSYQIPTPSSNQLDREHMQRLSSERDAIDKSYMECRFQSEINANHYSDIYENPESAKEITTTIVFLSLLFLVGVIYPMSFLPASTNGFEFSWAAIPEFYLSTKGLLLTTVTILFFAIVKTFYSLNQRLIYSEEDVSSLKSYTLIDTYSPAFLIRDLNEYDTENK